MAPKVVGRKGSKKCVEESGSSGGYRQRYLVEVFFHNLKRFRAIATRYEKTTRNYLALVQVACARLWLN
jgi:transposase